MDRNLKSTTTEIFGGLQSRIHPDHSSPPDLSITFTQPFTLARYLPDIYLIYNNVPEGTEKYGATKNFVKSKASTAYHFSLIPTKLFIFRGAVFFGMPSGTVRYFCCNTSDNTVPPKNPAVIGNRLTYPYCILSSIEVNFHRVFCCSRMRLVLTCEFHNIQY
ncbi:hypothetical protein L873DRAFT_108013 [Choiromyces venosus 120613-1]|uniref:Uncharacterized protein n=1 Tax=Choiromyces venosus 120613-1 TaxID=1336337 RepID=A0A3N4J470_9PEZI|nr:hypothetical protein L873DRAFT_108013 [Choiromyces venosus 120613-1]